MEETNDDPTVVETPDSSAQWWPSGLIQRLRSISMASTNETSTSKGKNDFGNSACQIASQTLWDTGKLAEPIPDGFYFVYPVSIQIFCNSLLFHIIND